LDLWINFSYVIINVLRYFLVYKRHDSVTGALLDTGLSSLNTLYGMQNLALIMGFTE